MNKTACRPTLTCLLITFIHLTCPLPQATAQQVTIYGKMDWGVYSTRGIPGSTVSGKGTQSGLAIQGNLTQNTYKITNASSISGLLPGMKITGAGIPDNATVVDASGTTILISRMITAATASDVNLNAGNNDATLVTAHADGLGGSLPGFTTCSLDSGVNYRFNGATVNPFPSSVSRVYASKLTVNANTSINKQVYVADTLTLANGNLTIPATDSLIITSGYAIAGAPFGISKHIVTVVDTSNSQGFLGVSYISGAYLLPVGTGEYYLPVTVTPASASSFIVNVYEGITVNGQSNGTAFSVAQKEKVVDAAWTVLRTSSNNDSCTLTLQWPSSLEGSSFSSSDCIGIIKYDTAWSTPYGTGDNTTNTATASFATLSTFSVGRKENEWENLSSLIPDKFKIIKKILSRIYPNPAINQLMVEYPLSKTRALITIYNTSGQVVYNQYTSTGRTPIQITSLKAGIYTLVISDGANSVSEKFVKME